jgi:multisubunit Na+/H+ antiporter MnhC subunit
MRPLAVLIGIVMGSTLSMAVALALTGIVVLLLPEHAERFEPEKTPLLQALVLTSGLTGLAAASFIGELRQQTWRLAAHAALLAGLGFAIWVYWPR